MGICGLGNDPAFHTVCTCTHLCRLGGTFILCVEGCGVKGCVGSKLSEDFLETSRGQKSLVEWEDGVEVG